MPQPSESSLPYSFPDHEFWRTIPAWQHVSREEFGDPRWQERHSILSMAGVEQALGHRLSPGLESDLHAGLQRTPMRLRLTPYLFALINWDDPIADPIRRQFLPLGSQWLPDHPFSNLDSLEEDADRVAPFLVHRYPDRALFLPLAICPVYCSFCTRSRLVGGSTPTVAKVTYGASREAWAATFEHIRTHPAIEDIVVSGGDAFMLDPSDLEHIGQKLLAIPHVRRLRIATRGLAALPMRITGDDPWVTVLARLNDAARTDLKEIAVHTHVNSAAELTGWSLAAARRLASLGIRVRTQSVLLRGVNDSFEAQMRLIKSLSFLQWQPYLMYLHDMVPGCEHLRTRLSDAQRLFHEVIGVTAGFNTPRFVCDAPGGGGKRVVSDCDEYDADLGVSAWTAPRVKPGRAFYYYDPISLLPDAGQRLWSDTSTLTARLAAFRARADARAHRQAEVAETSVAIHG